ncbi:PEP-CTERM sorting domain-containing protein [Rheinheimera maricola]|uniref:PEP-CTERM sorting domain-containing protein n=1 Tax=Rheinheimera maricola TaxID=2793282 RepID=A0ABS7XAW6_9GAMM|nr:PEP-CTERM sorting domain-containing protein [Rheinheimera maricola]MBZ9612682.1 PEP-CTERM sorting domain-containing protein [Rheinheimera maricola]
MKNTVTSMAKALFVMALFSAPVAATPIFTFDEPGNSFTNGSWDFALNFEVLNQVTVTGLGYFADPTTGAVDDNAVALYDSNQNLLASVIVTNTYDVFDFFRYVTISELILGPGIYQVVGVSNSDNYTWNNVNHIFDSNIAYVSNSWAVDTDGVANYIAGSQTDSLFGFSGPNVFIGDSRDFTNPNAVPAPATLAIFGLGLLGLVARNRKQK